MAAAVGIDLGTTNTVVATVREGVARTLAGPGGSRLLPSVVSFDPSGSVLVGSGAAERRVFDSANTIYSVKRLIGRAWTSPEVQQARGQLPFELREGPRGGSVVLARGESYSLPEISAFVLRQAKAVAEAALGEPVESAVITVPASFNDLQRAATKTAGALAGLQVLRILNEPTAAALAYGRDEASQQRIAIYDLGGGTFDVTLLDLAANVFEVVATAGDTALGGDDIDVVIAERIADELLKKHRFDARAQPAVFGRLRMLAESMKRALSTSEEHTLQADDLLPATRGGAVRWQFRMTRPELEWASLPLVERTFKVCQQALDSGGIRLADLHRVILVGGATRMPMVARKVEQFFGRAPLVRINPEEVVALGAAVQGFLLEGARERRGSGGTTTRPLIARESVQRAGPEQPEGVGLFLPGPSMRPLVFDEPVANALPPRELELAVITVPSRKPPPGPPGRALTIGPPPLPARARRPTMPYLFEPPPPALPAGVPVSSRPVVSFPSPAPLPAVPPPPEVAPPAPAQLRPAPLLIDVTPLGLGVETVGGFCDRLIDANTPVPCDRTRSFTTASDGQTSVHVRVAQGESKRFAENTFLGELELSGMQAAPRGATAVAVTFEIDVDGILNVRARDVNSGRETKAHLHLVGAETDERDIPAMEARQAAHPLAVEPAKR